ncbi:MAG: hypothetical protein LBT09_12875 [Planctomycetaceae bacterium]|jgi:hypothetical protein|nr:hypothetical protein [Planctomycetaceae bacterium]
MQDDFSNQYNGSQTGGSYQINGETYQVDVDYAPPKKSGCGGYGCLFGCGVGCLVLIIIMAVSSLLVYFYCIKGVPMQVSPETTLITSPLKSDGKSVDFFAVIKEKTEPQDSTKKNGFKDVLAAYGKDLIADGKQNELNHGWIFSELCKSFGLDPNFVPPHTYKEPKLAEFIPHKNKNENENEEDEVEAVLDNEYELTVFKKVLSKNWSIKEYPNLEEWLGKVDSGLDVVQKAAMEEFYFIPMVRRNENELAAMPILPVVVANEKLAYGLQVRSMLRIGEGKFGKAWDDLLASIRLQRNFIGKGIYAVNPRSDQVKLQIVKTVAESSSRWTPEQLTKAVADLETIPPNPKREDLLLVVQYILLDAFSMAGNSQQFVESISGQPIESHPTGKELKGLVSLMQLCGFNWNKVAKKFNEAVANHKKTINDADAEKILNLTNKDMKFEFDKFADKLSDQLQHKIADMFSVSGRSEIVGFIAGEYVPVLERYIFKQTINDEIHCRLLQTVFAIEKYKSEHKKYPDSLDQLKLNPPKISAITTIYEPTNKGYKISISDVELEIKPNTP